MFRGDSCLLLGNTKSVTRNFLIVTVFGKTKQLARKPIIVYARKYSFEHKDANGKRSVFYSKTKSWIGFKFGRQNLYSTL